MALGPFDALISSTIGAIGVPSGLLAGDFLALINAIIKKESTFNPSAVSYTNQGIGLMQVNPNVWSTVFNISREDLFDPATNIQIGSTILKDYINNYGLHGGLGSYFAGPAGRFSTAAQNYVNTVIGYWNNFKNALRSIIHQPSAVPGAFYFVDPVQNLDVSPDVEYISLANPNHIETDFDWTMVVLIFLGFYILSDL